MVRWVFLLFSISLLFACSSGEKPKPVEHPEAVRELLKEVNGYVGNMTWPLVGGNGTSSPFGFRRNSFHEGVDLRGDPGLPIHAAHSGKVVYAGDKMNGFGNVVIVKGEGLMTVYAHNRRNLVESGDIVNRGDTVAELGQTGRATGPHLHFETRVKNGKGRYVAVNPLLFYPIA